MEALGKAILSGFTGTDEVRADVLNSEPDTRNKGDELGAAITA